jgi:glutamate--cysteine ligase
MNRLDRTALLDTFASYGRPRDGWLVGAEFERHLLDEHGAPLTYGAPRGIRWMLERFVARGWEPIHEGPHLVATARGGASITLEPGCQWELSGRPHRRVIDCIEEGEAFNRATQEVLAVGGHAARQVFLGFTPRARIADIEWVPKGRYVQMREHMIKMGDLAHHMMKGTAAIQVSFDFLDEEDCARKMKLSSQLAPMTTALFANSSLAEGRPSGFMSWRGHIWTRTDPDRTGIPADRAFSYEAWIDYLLDVPMMFIQQDGGYVSGQGLSFRSWMEEGLDGRFPTWDDWELHMTSVFPEVRVKKQIEVRGADCVPMPLAGAFCALWEGLFYCDATLEETLHLAKDFVAGGTKEERFDQACRHGLQGTISGRPVLDWARDVVALAGRALDACAPHDRHLLHPLEAQLDRGRCPAREVLEAFEAGRDLDAIIDDHTWRPLTAARAAG